MKQPNWKTPLILSTTLFVLGSAAYWLEFSHRPKQEKVDSALKKPINLAEDAQIANFTIRGSKITLSAKCDEIAQKKCKVSDASAWSLTAPKEFRADTDNIKQLLNSVTNAVAAETIDLKDEPAEKRQKLLEEFGLSEAKRALPTTPSIQVVLDGAKKFELFFGIDHPLGDKHYAISSEDGKVNEQTVFLISSFIKGATDHDLTYFRDKSIFHFDRSLVKSFSGRNSSGPIMATKVENKWTINNTMGDSDKIETLISNIAQITAKDFPEDKNILKRALSIIQYTLEFEKVKISLEILEKNIGKSEKHFYLKTSVRPDIVEIEPAIRNQLDKKPSELRPAPTPKPTPAPKKETKK